MQHFPPQKQVCLEMLPAGAVWWMARSARAAMMALSLSGVLFRRKWEPPQLRPWETVSRSAAASEGGRRATGGEAAIPVPASTPCERGCVAGGSTIVVGSCAVTAHTGRGRP
jgi:hypothetical protein